LHGVYDFTASMQNDIMSIIFLIFVGWMFRTALKLVRKVSAEDSPLVQIDGHYVSENGLPGTDKQYRTQESFKEEESWR